LEVDDVEIDEIGYIKQYHKYLGSAEFVKMMNCLIWLGVLTNCYRPSKKKRLVNLIKDLAIYTFFTW
jgi:hypothetical protein